MNLLAAFARRYARDNPAAARLSGMDVAGGSGCVPVLRRAAALAARGEQLVANGQAMWAMIERGEGIHIWTRSGKKLIDAFAGLAVVHVGHGRTEIADAIPEHTYPNSSRWIASARTLAPEPPTSSG